MNFFDPRPLKYLKITNFYYKVVKSRRSDDDLRVKVITPFEFLNFARNYQHRIQMFIGHFE